MREYCTSGTVRGAPGNRCPYRGNQFNLIQPVVAICALIGERNN